MWLFVVLLIIIIFSYAPLSRGGENKKAYVVFIFAILGAMMMLRSTAVGNDTDVYAQYYREFNSAESMSQIITRFEFGFVLLVRALGKISADPQILFIVTGAFTAFAFGRFIYKYCSLPWLGALMFFTLEFYDMAMSGIRQIIAASVLTFAFDMAVKRKPLRFILLVLLASTLHNSAILFLILYPLAMIKMDPKTILLIGTGGVAAFIGFGKIILPLVAAFFPAYLKYFTESGDSFSSVPKLSTGLMFALWTALFIISYQVEKNYISPENDYENAEAREAAVISARTVNIETLSMLLAIVMILWSLQGTILTRFKFVFSFPMLAYYPNALDKIPDREARAFMLVASAAIFIAYIAVIYIFRPEWQSTFPYKFFWQA